MREEKRGWDGMKGWNWRQKVQTFVVCVFVLMQCTQTTLYRLIRQFLWLQNGQKNKQTKKTHTHTKYLHDQNTCYNRSGFQEWTTMLVDVFLPSEF